MCNLPAWTCVHHLHVVLIEARGGCWMHAVLMEVRRGFLPSPHIKSARLHPLPLRPDRTAMKTELPDCYLCAGRGQGR